MLKKGILKYLIIIFNLSGEENVEVEILKCTIINYYHTGAAYFNILLLLKLLLEILILSKRVICYLNKIMNKRLQI